MSDDALCVSVTDHFKQWGTLATVKVLRDTCNRPYAFVQYTTDSDSKLAIEKGHNSVLDGRNISEAAKVNAHYSCHRNRFLAKVSLEIGCQILVRSRSCPSTSKGSYTILVLILEVIRIGFVSLLIVMMPLELTQI